MPSGLAVIVWLALCATAIHAAEPPTVTPDKVVVLPSRFRRAVFGSQGYWCMLLPKEEVLNGSESRIFNVPYLLRIATDVDHAPGEGRGIRVNYDGWISVKLQWAGALIVRSGGRAMCLEGASAGLDGANLWGDRRRWHYQLPERRSCYADSTRRFVTHCAVNSSCTEIAIATLQMPWHTHVELVEYPFQYAKSAERPMTIADDSVRILGDWHSSNMPVHLEYFNRDNNVLLALRENELFVFNASCERRRKTVISTRFQHLNVSGSPTTKKIAIAGRTKEGCSVCVIRSGKEFGDVKQLDAKHVTSVAFSPCGNVLAVVQRGKYSDLIRFWKASQGWMPFKIQPPRRWHVDAVAWSPKNGLFLVAMSDHDFVDEGAGKSRIGIYNRVLEGP